MLYTLHEAGYYASTPLRFAARADARLLVLALNPAADTDLGRRIQPRRGPLRQRHPPLRQARTGASTSVKIEGQVDVARPPDRWSGKAPGRS